MYSKMGGWNVESIDVVFLLDIVYPSFNVTWHMGYVLKDGGLE